MSMYNTDHITTLISERILNKSPEQKEKERLEEARMLRESRLVDGISKTRAFLSTLDESQRVRFLQSIR
ncbi:hypothetical protein AsFcp4_54 [Aeromonas phage AsFcp_4]|uniref:Uncharacterized protein n=1 Tax=Aeromonas phage PX29 TaxID=926067 RepID=E5DQF5_9CAUD|nr:hypothetical protein CL89_gp256 [Aeromonas phage PX29]ADQ52941.1 conserved hypothetical protein [Aeromonas phage PX29]QAX98479.1 hypothetical protein ASfcp2_141 [Aeromonas phage AsFcp_2]QAX99511.1 hypothetical protein AsFcp4_54 [Aeromonas phage AsFcp_4]